MHVCIIGAGLAGACATQALLPHARVTLLERSIPASGASGVAAGLVNPFMGRHANPLSSLTERLAALQALFRTAAVPTIGRGLVRPANTAAQAVQFAARADEYPDLLAWYPPASSNDAWPCVSAPFGSLFVRDGCAVDVERLVQALVEQARVDGATVRLGMEGSVEKVASRPAGVLVQTQRGDPVEVDRVLFCTGGTMHPLLAHLPLHRVKGQLIRLHTPTVAPELPLVAGNGYLVPEGDTVVVGSTFEHTFTHLDPTPEGIAQLRETAAALVPALRDAPVAEARAGVRVTVPGRQPLLQPLDDAARLWVFNGLGAKGLLTAPWLARHLWGYLCAPHTLPVFLRGKA